MTAANLIALAERCEAATGADRDLDLAVMMAAENIPMVFGGRLQREDEQPAYTASLDAAMTLVPEGVEHYGFDRNLTGDILSAPHITTQAFIDGGAPDFSQYHRAEAATPALAICAAALRARAAQ